MPPSDTQLRSPLGRVLRSPGVLRAVTPYAAGRIGTTMELLAVLLLTQHTSGSYASAGAITACYAAGAAFLPNAGVSPVRRPSVRAVRQRNGQVR